MVVMGNERDLKMIRKSSEHLKVKRMKKKKVFQEIFMPAFIT